jgi:hypothetical protein
MRSFRKVLLLAATCTLVAGCASETTKPPSQQGGAPGTAPMSGVHPEAPAAMVAAPGGSVYIADDQRQEIFLYHPNGSFQVVAGNGIGGFSGDGGAATAAEIDDPGGMALRPGGALYFADQGNGRVREITRSGSILTVAGDGHSGWVADGTPAHSASLSPSDVVFGPDSLMYLSSGQEVLRLDNNGTLSRVAGTQGPQQGLVGLGGPATAAAIDGANGLAFDSHGNLYLAGSATKTLLMVNNAGQMTAPHGNGNFYPRGVAGLVESPSGSIIGMTGLSLVRFEGGNEETIFSFATGTFHGIKAFSPNGIAVTDNGAIYVDTDAGNGFTSMTALAMIDPARSSSKLLWRSTS